MSQTITLKFVTHEGEVRALAVQPGQTLMQAAVDQQVDGIPGECGGAMACGTCHIYLEDVWQELTGAPSDLEQSLLEVSGNCQTNSRLGCQVLLTEEMDGMQVHLPACQLI